MEHHCHDLRAALKGLCAIDVKSCGKKWESLGAVVDAASNGYDRIYVAGELLGQVFVKSLRESLRSKVFVGVHSFFLWDNNRSIGKDTANASHCNAEFIATLLQCRRAAVICKTLQSSLSSLNPCLAHYGINTAYYHPLSSGLNEKKRLQIGWVGALLKHKNYHIFQQIKEQLADRADCREILVTPDRYLSLSQSILSREDMNRFYNELDLVVVTANSEGGPLPPMEAAACGVPTLTPYVGCMPEFIRNELDGYLIDSYDAEEYVRVIIRLSENREILRNMKAACLEKAFGPWNLHNKASIWREFFLS